MQKLKIALTADPELPVPPRNYGGIERIVDMLANGLVNRGHEVTLFAHRDSKTAGRLAPWPGHSSRSPADTALNAARLTVPVLAARFDLIHSFSRVAYLSPILPLSVPKLMTYQRPIAPRSVSLGNWLSRGTLWFSAVSRGMIANVSAFGTWHVVYNGVPLRRYAFNPDPGPDAPLVFLGRIEEIKGPHIAIEVAKRSGVPLVIAGNVQPEHRGWFEGNIAPHIDGSRVRYIGPVDDAQKNNLLRRARALLMPILWDEPFGIVMAEAMACGTPVIGFDRGAVSEVVANGETGFVVSTPNEMVAAVARLSGIERKRCRMRVEALFSDDAMTEEYLRLYCNMLGAASSSMRRHA